MYLAGAGSHRGVHESCEAASWSERRAQACEQSRGRVSEHAAVNQAVKCACIACARSCPIQEVLRAHLRLAGWGSPQASMGGAGQGRGV